MLLSCSNTGRLSFSIAICVLISMFCVDSSATSATTTHSITRPFPHIRVASIPLLVLEEDVFHFELYMDENITEKIAFLLEGKLLSMSNSTHSEFLENLSHAMGTFDPELKLKDCHELVVDLQMQIDKICLTDEACQTDSKINFLMRYARKLDDYFEDMLSFTPPTFDLGYHPELMALVDSSYHKYAGELNEMKEFMRYIYTNSYATVSPQYDDIESELTTLFLLHYQPKKIMEFSPSHGWSTLLIMNAIMSYQLANPETVEVKSYDLEDFCSGAIEEYVPSVLRPDSLTKWSLTTGDVRSFFETDFLSSTENPVDYLFIDSDHTKDFVLYYIQHLLTPLLQQARRRGKPIFVSVHDCFVNGVKSHEGAEVLNFLSRNQLRFFNPNQKQHQSEIRRRREETLSSIDPIHFVGNNPSIYFILA
mmetsp:Transcript_28385/g.47973  ORF Transcript_28385/g.47973 Transcript_28385/m.47973 type:complete len:422 (-) Transcript_28385:712-1977(-)|eukprot:CAMPEP_0114428942 /NCGR_PEP_ID=MMETSP0103-20121206/9209_1 /TAXON_ID=37642 ORGANISM="Paraphysomonas imperforata, Strain PA2" /NCGR_SAMPLE_ID=MMETSP0103 /ASSEMBLY_ACC=CAM_ASM_000201 /LENGTH=421 /DNA_ID=CAMNT_0001598221 /DNA_START=219 /DNA_END=1487 /DNA_ORIENTATION=+